MMRAGIHWISSKNNGPWREPPKPKDTLRLVLNMIGPALDWRLQVLAEQRPGVRARPTTMDPEDVRRALRAGACGYCPKSAGPATLQAVLRLVLDGEVYVPPFMALLPTEPAEPVHASGLTARQLEVLQLLCKGHANKDIGRLLGMQEKTVKGHVSAIFRALKVVHRLQAVEAARATGIAGC
jgi:DNA-binding NarL/FixJ family response regulator